MREGWSVGAVDASMIAPPWISMIGAWGAHRACVVLDT